MEKKLFTFKYTEGSVLKEASVCLLVVNTDKQIDDVHNTIVDGALELEFNLNEDYQKIEFKEVKPYPTFIKKLLRSKRKVQCFYDTWTVYFPDTNCSD